MPYPVPNRNPGYPYRTGGGPLIATLPLPSYRPQKWDLLRFACPAFNRVWADGGFHADIPVLDPTATDPQIFLQGAVVLGPDARKMYVVMVEPYTPGDIQQDIMDHKIAPVNPENMVYMQYTSGNAYQIGDIVADNEFLYWATQDYIATGNIQQDIVNGLLRRVRPTNTVHYPYASGIAVLAGDVIVSGTPVLKMYYVVTTHITTGNISSEVSNGSLSPIGVSWAVPDWGNRSSSTVISASGGSWTATANGWLYISVSAGTNYVITLNGTSYTMDLSMVPVATGDTVVLNNATSGAYFVPARGNVI